MVRYIVFEVGVVLFNLQTRISAIGETLVPHIYLDAPDLNSTILFPGMVVAVICHAQGGNPVPEVSLYRNNEPLGQARPGQNSHTWIVKKEDNSAYLRCDAINQAMQGPAMAEIGLRVECE